jgi:transposase
LPPSVDEWLPHDHLARFVVEVIERLDLDELTRQYAGRGSAAHHPAVLLGLLVYGYASGVHSSRKIERATYDSVAFRYVAANTHPDHDTLATFRRRFLKEIEALFVQVLVLAREMKLLKLGTIALDGTKVKANASKHKALSWAHSSIEYHSISSGRTEREIVPFALIDNGLRWHVRAFDRKSQEFRDFVITRIKRPVVLKGQPVAPHEMSDQDIQWTRIVELELVPHPDQPRPEITEMDYSMQGGVLRMKLRAATAGYILRQWSVDCTPDHSLRGPEYRLWLKDHLAIYGVRNAVLAPGYRSPDQQRLEAESD